MEPFKMPKTLDEKYRDYNMKQLGYGAGLAAMGGLAPTLVTGRFGIPSILGALAGATLSHYLLKGEHPGKFKPLPGIRSMTYGWPGANLER